MMKIGFAVAAAAAVLMTAPSLVKHHSGQGPNPKDGPRRRCSARAGPRRPRPSPANDSDVTIGVGPGGVTVGPRQNCRMVTTTVERDDGRTITRKERRCD
jgi:hypothetical protein